MIFGFVLSRTRVRISLVNFINVKISLQGGAVYISGGSGTFDSCSFEGNTAGYGGAVYIGGGSGTFDSCSFDGNTANVSTHDNIGFENECSKFVDCICVVPVVCF